MVLWKPKGVDDKVKNQGKDICAALRQINGTFIRKVIAESRRRRRHRLCHRARRSVLQTASIRRARGGAPLHWRQFCGLLLKIPFHFLTTVYCNLYCISIDEMMSWFIFVHTSSSIDSTSIILRPHFGGLDRKPAGQFVDRISRDLGSQSFGRPIAQKMAMIINLQQQRRF